MAMRRAADARFLINGVLYAVAEWDVNDESQEIDVSNTEAIPANFLISGGLAGTREPCRSYLGDIVRVRGTIHNATWDELSGNPYLPPYFIVASSYVSLTYFPSGLAFGRRGPWNVLVTRVLHRGRVGQGAQPMSFEFTSDGESILEYLA